MAAGDERRRIARRLREPFDVVGHGRYVALSGTIFGMQVMAGSEDALRSGIAQLADLIDPGTEAAGDKLIEPGAEVACDKLIALADEMVEMLRIGADTGEGLDYKWCRELHDKYVRRIRDACGVRDARA